MGWSEAANLLWCAALPFVGFRAWDGWRAVRPRARVPMQWGLDGRPSWRAGRNLAFGVTPAVSVLLWVMLSLLPEDHDAWTFAGNLTAAAAVVLVSVFYVRAAVRGAA